MKTSHIVALVIGVLLVAFALVSTSYCFSIYNTQKRLWNLYDAKMAANKSDLSNLKSKLTEVASVTTAQMDQLSALFTAHAAARTPESSSAIMTWVQETVPNVDQSTFRNLQNIVASTRDSWAERQKELNDIGRAFNDNLDTNPRGWLLGMFGDFERIKPFVIITNDTAKAFETGRDEPLNLFRK